MATLIDGDATPDPADWFTMAGTRASTPNYACPNCGRRFTRRTGQRVCATIHAFGECCHAGEVEIDRHIGDPPERWAPMTQRGIRHFDQPPATDPEIGKLFTRVDLFPSQLQPPPRRSRPAWQFVALCSLAGGIAGGIGAAIMWFVWQALR